MNKSRLFFVILFITTSFVQINQTLAKESTADNDERYLLSKDTYDLLNLARDAMTDQKYQLAVQKLDSYLLKSELKAYDTAVINQTLGYAYNLLGNYQSAIMSFEKALTADALPEKVAHEINYNIAQLLIQSEKYAEGLSYLDKWFAKENQPSTDAHLLAATAYYKIDKFRQLIPHAKSAIEISDSPQQSWYELLLAGYYESGMLKDAASLLETLIDKYPENNNYWLQLAAVYQQDKQDKKSLAVSELAYEKGILQSDNIIQLAQTYLYLQLPLKAAMLLDKELKSGKIEPARNNIELLVNSWLLAHEPERAAKLLQRFVKKFNDASLYYKLGHIYIELERWDKAMLALESSVADKGPESNREIKPNTWLLLGIAAFHNKKLQRSTEVFNKALEFKETRDQAQWWLSQISEQTSVVSINDATQ